MLRPDPYMLVLVMKLDEAAPPCKIDIMDAYLNGTQTTNLHPMTTYFQLSFGFLRAPSNRQPPR